MIPLSFNYVGDLKTVGSSEYSILSNKKKPSNNLTISEIKLIVILTLKGVSRPKIAREINKSPQCVFNWQRKFFE
jgi:hypothetical protein